MWLARQMIEAQRRQPAAEASYLAEGDGAEGANRYLGVELAAPWGIEYAAPDYARATLVATQECMVCVGTAMQASGLLEAGELRLFSRGGAEIILRNDGTVSINGRVFEAKEG